MWNGKDMILHLIGVLMKVIWYQMGQYFPKPYKSFEGNVNVKVDFSNYATKWDTKISHRLTLQVLY